MRPDGGACVLEGVGPEVLSELRTGLVWSTEVKVEVEGASWMDRTERVERSSGGS